MSRTRRRRCAHLQTLLQYLGETDVVTAPSGEEALHLLGQPRKDGDGPVIDAAELEQVDEHAGAPA